MRSGRPRGPGKALQMWGASPPTFFKAFPGPRGRPDLLSVLTRPKRRGATTLPVFHVCNVCWAPQTQKLTTSHPIVVVFVARAGARGVNTGYLKAVWPDFVGCVFEVWPAPGGPGKPSNVEYDFVCQLAVQRPTERRRCSWFYFMLRSSVFGPEIGFPGRMLAGPLPGKHQNRPFGRPEGRFRFSPGSSPAKIRPGRPSSGPEVVFCNIE